MDITWLGRRCFAIRGRDITVVTDPYSGAFPRLPKGPAVKAVTLSRDELDGHMPSSDDNSPRVIKGPGEYEVANIFITGVATRYESRDEQGRGVISKNTIYSIELEGLVLCHLGELQTPLTSEQMEGMRAVSILLVPVGDPTSLRASMDTVSLLEPNLVVPMDYPGETREGEHPPQALTRFLKEMSAKRVEPQKRLHITTSTLPQQTQVVALESSS